MICSYIKSLSVNGCSWSYANITRAALDAIRKPQIANIEYDVDRNTSTITAYNELTLASQRPKGTCSEHNQTASYSDALLAVTSATARIPTHTQGITTKHKGAVRSPYHSGNAMP